MIDHISVRVSDFPRAVAFYKQALAPIGYELCMEFPGFAGFGEKGKPDLWITASEKAINPTHVAMRATRAQIDAFHAAGLAAGGKDDGAPGLRAEYHPNYYAAFILDPDGNSVECVNHAPPEAPKAAAKPARKAAAKPAKKAAAKPAKKAAAKPAKKAAAKAKKKPAKKKR